MNLERRNGHTAYSTNDSGQVVRAGHGIVFDLGGPVIESLRGSNEEDAYCVMKGTLRPGASVLLHSHDDPESFYVLCGEAEVLIETVGGLAWHPVRRGDFADIPAGMKHAWRNPHNVPFEVVASMTPKLGRFLRELGELIKNEGVKPERIRELEQHYGYWSRTAEENAAAGIAILSW